ncbi:MAG: hypothetical protein ABFD58_08575 [Anaerolineaceae bacterium]
MNEDNARTNTPSDEEEIMRFVDVGSRKVYNKSFAELRSLSEKLGVPIKAKLIAALSVVGALEERKALTKAAEQNQLQ